MNLAIELSQNNVGTSLGGPFGAVIVKDGKVIATGSNQVTSTMDPTAHAEVVAIREACKNLESFNLGGCQLYTSCEPCPMCLGAIYWSRMDKVYFANTRIDAAQIGFDDQLIYDEINLENPKRSIPFIQINDNETLSRARQVFQNWFGNVNKIKY